MIKIKYMIKTGLVSVVLAGGVALPAAAQQSAVCTGDDLTLNLCPNVNIDNSDTRTTALGDGSAIIRNNVSQSQVVAAVTNQANVGVAAGVGVGGAGTGVGLGLLLGDGVGVGVGGDGTGVGANDQSNSAVTSATGTQSNAIVFAPKF